MIFCLIFFSNMNFMKILKNFLIFLNFQYLSHLKNLIYIYAYIKVTQKNFHSHPNISVCKKEIMTKFVLKS